MKGKLQCDCGCQQDEFLNKLRKVEIETAIDETLRQTTVGKRFLVRAECEQAFIHELQCKRVLEDIVRRYKLRRSGFFRRLTRVRGVVRLQLAINLRNKGFDRARRISVRSGLMFLASHRISGWLDLYWRWRDQRKATA